MVVENRKEKSDCIIIRNGSGIKVLKDCIEYITFLMMQCIFFTFRYQIREEPIACWMKKKGKIGACITAWEE
jgi:hypothetical protein